MGRGTIELKAVGGSDGTVEIHVLDKGRGFGNEFIDRAFERFSRGASATATVGPTSGLELPTGKPACSRPALTWVSSSPRKSWQEFMI